MRSLHSPSASLGSSVPSYFADEPGSPWSPTSPPLPSPSPTKSLLKSEGFAFHHFPAENAHFTSEPFASNPKLASILRCSTYGNLSPMIPIPTSVIPEEDPVLHVIPESVSIILDDVMVPTQSALEGELSYTSSDVIFEGKSREKAAGSESNFGFALSGLTHLEPVRNAFKYTGASIPGSSTGQGHGQWSARSTSKHDEQSKGSRSFQEPAKIISPGKSDKEISSATSSFSMTTRSSRESGSPMVTMRFEHREDENGHHVLIGREGKLARCSDEPIRVPGAVQGFGVLMVLQDDRTTGTLPVRQVSEVCLSLRKSSPSQILPELQCDPWRHTKVSLQPRLLHGHVATKPSRSLLGQFAGSRRTRLRLK